MNNKIIINGKEFETNYTLIAKAYTYEYFGVDPFKTAYEVKTSITIELYAFEKELMETLREKELTVKIEDLEIPVKILSCGNDGFGPKVALTSIKDYHKSDIQKIRNHISIFECNKGEDYGV